MAVKGSGICCDYNCDCDNSWIFLKLENWLKYCNLLVLFSSMKSQIREMLSKNLRYRCTSLSISSPDKLKLNIENLHAYSDYLQGTPLLHVISTVLSLLATLCTVLYRIQQECHGQISYILKCRVDFCAQKNIACIVMHCIKQYLLRVSFHLLYNDLGPNKKSKL